MKASEFKTMSGESPVVEKFPTAAATPVDTNPAPPKPVYQPVGWFCPGCGKHHAPHAHTCPQGC